MAEKKTIFELEVKCPHCSKLLDVKKMRRIIKEAVKGEFEDNITVRKSQQKTLE